MRGADTMGIYANEYNVYISKYIYMYVILCICESNLPRGVDMSLKVGLGAMADSKKSPLGWRPSGPCCMHIVPPVPIMRTLDSGSPAELGVAISRGMIERIDG